MQRSPKFAENILERYGNKPEDVQEEVLMFGCPYCGHISPDHRWTPPGDCLIEGCDCPNILEMCDQETARATRAAICEVLTA